MLLMSARIHSQDANVYSVAMQHLPLRLGKMAETSHPQQNHILDALPQPERERLFPHLKLVTLPLGKSQRVREPLAEVPRCLCQSILTKAKFIETDLLMPT